MRTIRSYTKLTKKERDLLAVWKAEGKSNKRCARELGRSIATIGRELKRNSFQGKYYVAIHAQERANKRQWKAAHGKQALKNDDLYAYVTKKLKDGWSPDQIAGRLKRDHPADKRWWITAETIYRWIYAPEQKKAVQPWYEYLRRKQKKRKKRSGRKVHSSHIPDRVSIKDLPEEVNMRRDFGHWEGDTVEGKGHKNGIHTEVERMSRKILSAKVKAISSEEAIKAQKQLFCLLPKEARESTRLITGKKRICIMNLKPSP